MTEDRAPATACPFCKSTRAQLHCAMGEHWVLCRKDLGGCGASGPAVNSAVVALAWWNCRSPSAEPPSLREELDRIAAQFPPGAVEATLADLAAEKRGDPNAGVVVMRADLETVRSALKIAFDRLRNGNEVDQAVSRRLARCEDKLDVILGTAPASEPKLGGVA